MSPAKTKARDTRRRTGGTRAPARKPAAPGKGTAWRNAPRRADFGAPIDAFFARQPPRLRAILVELRGLVEAAAPDATASIKWGMPFFSIGREMMCALGAFKEHVNLVLPGPSWTYADPGGRLEGESVHGRHIKLRTLEELPRADVRRWVRAAAERARERAEAR